MLQLIRVYLIAWEEKKITHSLNACFSLRTRGSKRASTLARPSCPPGVLAFYRSVILLTPLILHGLVHKQAYLHILIHTLSLSHSHTHTHTHTHPYFIDVIRFPTIHVSFSYYLIQLKSSWYSRETPASRALASSYPEHGLGFILFYFFSNSTWLCQPICARHMHANPLFLHPYLTLYIHLSNYLPISMYLPIYLYIYLLLSFRVLMIVARFYPLCPMSAPCSLVLPPCPIHDPPALLCPLL